MPVRSLFISLCLFTGLQFALVPVLHATESRTDYAIDIVVFEDSEGRYLNSEQWSAPAPVTNEQPAAATAAGTNVSTTTSPANTPADATQNPDIHDIDPGKYDLLNNAVKRLTNSSRYHILVRKSWIQLGLDSKSAVDINMNSANDPESAGAVGSLTGSVKIVLERYLHLYTDLVYHRPDKTAVVPAGDAATQVSSSAIAPPAPVQEFVIKEHRRMRSSELHYIDYPLVGILIKIVPVETKIKTTP